MNQRERRNKQRQFAEKNAKKKNHTITESEQQKILNEVANNEEPREENPEKAEFGAERISINQLDHDCLANIFLYLPALDRLEIKRVCEKWKEAVEISWHNVKKIDTGNLAILKKKKEVTLMELLENCCQYFTHLTIDHLYSWVADILENNCKNIVYFDVHLCSKYSHSLNEIIRSMTKLKCLKAQVHDKRNLQSLCNQLSNILPADIEEIHLVEAERYYASNEFPDAPALDKFINLRCLTLGNFFLTPATMESILLNKNTLVYLDLNGCHFQRKCPIIFSKLIHLEHLSLRDVDTKGRVYSNNEMVTEIAHNCQKLKYFVYSESEYEGESVPRSTFRELKYLKNLEHLDFPIVGDLEDGDNIMSDVVDNCKKLKCLNVGSGKNFSMSDYEEITKLKNLECLDLYYASPDPQSVINIARNCLELRELFMDNEWLDYFIPDYYFEEFIGDVHITIGGMSCNNNYKPPSCRK